MTPNPYQEFSRMQSADRVQRAYEDSLAKQAKKIKPRNPNGSDSAHRTMVGLLVTWAVFMTVMVGLWVWLGI